MQKEPGWDVSVGKGECREKSACHLQLAHGNPQHGAEDVVQLDGAVDLMSGVEQCLQPRNLLLQMETAFDFHETVCSFLLGLGCLYRIDPWRLMVPFWQYRGRRL